MICGGSEAAITPMSVGGFASMKALSTRNEEPARASRPFDKDRDGFVIGEGAGILVLEELEMAKARGATIYAEVVGYGMSGDAFHITQPSEDGDWAHRVMVNAIIDAGLKPEQIGYINAHGTSTPFNDKLETLAIKKVFGDHGLQLKAEKRFAQGLSFLGSYTFSKFINTGGDGFNASSSPQDPNCLRCDRGLSAFDRTNIFAFNFVYELPFGKGKRFGNDMNAAGNVILGGWQFNGIITASSGQPLTATIPRDIANIGARAIGQRPNLNGNPNIDNPTASHWFDTSVFSEPAPYTFGNAGRGIIFGPGN